jgi:hypothetical protein
LIDLFLHLDPPLWRKRPRSTERRSTGSSSSDPLPARPASSSRPSSRGDSLLFACGALAATGALDLRLLLVVIPIAVILGDNTNYFIGRFVGPRAFTSKTRWLKREHLDRTHAFYERHGGKTIVMARFVPIVRTFAPFVAGIGRMAYGRFLAYSVGGGHPVGRRLHRGRIRLRQHPGREGQLLDRGHPHRRDLSPADRDRVDEASEKGGRAPFSP